LFLQKSIKQFKLKILDEQIFLMFFVWMFLFIYSLISPLICTNPIVKQKSGKNIFVSKDVFLLMNLQYSFYSYVSFIWFMYHKIMGFPNERAGIFYAKLNEFRKKEKNGHAYFFLPFCNDTLIMAYPIIIENRLV